MWQKGDSNPAPFNLPCGGVAHFDYDSGYSYRCDVCFSVVGSIGMPSHCATLLKDKQDKAQVWNALSVDH